MSRRIPSASSLLHRYSAIQLVVDGALVALAYYLAFRLRFDGGTPDRYQELFSKTLIWIVPLTLSIFTVFGLYHKWWRYTAKRDYESILRAVVVATLAVVGFVAVLHPVKFETGTTTTIVGLPSGVIALYGLLTLLFVAGVRFSVHTVFERSLHSFSSKADARNVLIVGGGDGGQLVLREIVRNPDLGYRPVGFVDDDPAKQGRRVANGLKVLGNIEELDRVLDETDPDEVVIAIPSAPGTLRAKVVSTCRNRDIPVRTLPTVFELLQTNGTKVVNQIREVQVEDVLGRQPLRMDLKRAGGYLNGSTVLVTGAGGSVGSELCRQISRVGPGHIVLIDHAEQSLFEIKRELEEDHHFTKVTALLVDCKNREHLLRVFNQHRPEYVFHAAAYKHVPLMEDNPIEAIRNNTFATRTLAEVAGQSGVKRFVFVSTDKAVDPRTVMGASKGLAEWALELAAESAKDTEYVSVRFGNVLGSSGSVVPIFKRQIKQGGPVTVTDEQMTRFFMTIPEAVQLIIRSGSLESTGSIFVLDMGEPVSILELAKDMIRLSGLEPDKDIAIEIVGARPGEKIHEELFNPFETPRETEADRILCAERPRLDNEWAVAVFEKLEKLVQSSDATAVAKEALALTAKRTAQKVSSAP